MKVWKGSLQRLSRDKILSLLGLATRSRKTVSGEFMVEKIVKSGGAYLLIVAEDTSEGSKKNYKDMCNFYRVPLFFYATKEQLGHCIGKEIRACVAVTDEGFANRLMELMKDSTVNTEVIK